MNTQTLYSAKDKLIKLIETAFHSHFDPQSSLIIDSFDTDTRRRALTAFRKRDHTEVERYTKSLRLIHQNIDISDATFLKRFSKTQE